MKIFSKLYTWTMQCSRHRHAPYYLSALSFAESSVFPIPPDVMLAPMALAKPERAWFYASLTTIASVLGGLFGYILGLFFFDLVHPYILQLGYAPAYEKAVSWFGLWGFWVIFIAAFTPIPYKVFTIAGGVVGMPIFVFIIASIIGRGARFFMVATFMRWGGERMEKLLHSYVDRIGWAVLGLLLLGVLAFQLTGCTTRGKSAPVVSGIGKIPTTGVYQAKARETLFSVAWRYGLDYRKLAAINHLAPPYKLHAGQRIKLRDTAAAVIPSSTPNPNIVIASTEIKTSTDISGKWRWPTQGTVVATFDQGSTSNKGIDITAPEGAPVIATAAGKVVYSGAGLKGYGELIIIKHNDEFLSAYAHNKKLLVREGAQVKAGQTIAQVGDTDAKQVMLHFEIRKAGKPVDPLNYLPKK